MRASQYAHLFFPFGILNSLPSNDVCVRPQGNHRVTQDVYLRHNGQFKACPKTEPVKKLYAAKEMAYF